MKTTQFGVARDGMKVDRVVWFVADFADGLITRYRAFIDEQAALAAAGVDARPPDSELSGADDARAIPELRSRGGSSASGGTGKPRHRSEARAAEQANRGGGPKR